MIIRKKTQLYFKRHKILFAKCLRLYVVDALSPPKNSFNKCASNIMNNNSKGLEKKTNYFLEKSKYLLTKVSIQSLISSANSNPYSLNSANILPNSWLILQNYHKDSIE